MRLRRGFLAAGYTLFALCRIAFPARFRGRHGQEMTDAYRAELGRRLEVGVGSALAYTARSCADLLRMGMAERIRGGRSPSGHGAVRTGGAGSALMDGIWTDATLALRGLRRAPGFTAAATVVLALGIGANTAVFSALREAVLAPPPFPEADRLVIADLTRQASADAPAEPLTWSFPKFLAFLEQEGRLIEVAAGYANRAATLTEVGPAEMVNLEVVSPGYFALVGRDPVIGRAFTPEQMGPGDVDPVTVLSWELWRSRFGGDPSAVGEDLVLNGIRLRIVGVAPEGFDGLTGGARLWLPMSAAGDVFSPFMLEGSGAHWFHVLGRLADGATLENARAQMQGIGDGIAELYPSSNVARVYSGSARSLASVRSNDRAKASVLLLTGAAAVVLLVACANLSGLMLARARRRTADGAVRAAVGASRWRLVRASLVESLLLAACGGAAGVGVAFAGTRVMASAWPSRFLSGQDGAIRIMDPEALGVDPALLLFALAVTGLTGIVFGIGPALRASRADLIGRLRNGAGGTRRDRRIGGLDSRGLLVGAQIALALVLVIGAGLVGGSTLRLLEVDEGFDAENLVAFAYTLPLTNSRVAESMAFHEELLARVRAIPGVRSATFGCPPLRGHCIITSVDAIQGGPEFPAGDGLEIGVRMVDDEHFEALGIPLVRGRVLDRTDGTDARPAVVINEFAAARLFPDSDPIGRFIELGVGSADREDFSEVVGVVGDVLYSAPDQGVMAEAYYSFREYPENYGSVTVRTTGDPLLAVPAMREAMAEIDPTVAIYRVETIDELIVRSVGDRRATVALLGLFAAVTLLLAATGTWGVVSYSVTDRRRELGLRIALGAGEGRVLRRVVGQGVRIAVFGIVLGIAGGLGASRLLEAVLWETEPTDPVVYASGALLLLGVVLLASWVPARRAMRVDPVEALRAE